SVSLFLLVVLAACGGGSSSTTTSSGDLTGFYQGQFTTNTTISMNIVQTGPNTFTVPQYVTSDRDGGHGDGAGGAGAMETRKGAQTIVGDQSTQPFTIRLISDVKIGVTCNIRGSINNSGGPIRLTGQTNCNDGRNGNFDVTQQSTTP